MAATETLEHEHKIILLVLEAAEDEAKSIGKTGSVNTGRASKMLDFFRNFTDRCHHAKEEQHLFVKLQERGVAREGGPIGVMLREHEEGRRRVKGIADALPQAEQGRKKALAALRENLSGYADLLRAHIEKENGVLFPMARRALTPDDQQALREAFEKVEAEEMGEGVHEKHHQLAHELTGE